MGRLASPLVMTALIPFHGPPKDCPCPVEQAAQDGYRASQSDPAPVGIVQQAQGCATESVPRRVQQALDVGRTAHRDRYSSLFDVVPHGLDLWGVRPAKTP